MALYSVALVSLTGYFGLFKYYVAPLVVFYIWHSISNRVQHNLATEPTIISQIVEAAKQMSPSNTSVVTLSRLVGKVQSLSHSDDGFLFKLFQKMCGWEQITPAAFVDLKRDFLAAASEPSFINLEQFASAPINKSWEGYYFDWSKVIKLIGIHVTGGFGAYLLFTADVSIYTIMLAVFMYYACGIGITAGYHRHWSHKSYETTKIMQFILAFFGAGAGEGSILWWSRDHRMHHKYGDSPCDPYPIIHGFWWAHIGLCGCCCIIRCLLMPS